MYCAKRKAPAILTEPFNKTDGAFRLKKSLCLIFLLTELLPFFISGATINGYTYSPEYYTCKKVLFPFI